jgi:hypothetical protein
MAPASKKQVDEDNLGHNSSHQIKGLKTHGDFEHSVHGQEPLKKDYSNFNHKD